MAAKNAAGEAAMQQAAQALDACMDENTTLRRRLTVLKLNAETSGAALEQRYAEATVKANEAAFAFFESDATESAAPQSVDVTGFECGGSSSHPTSPTGPPDGLNVETESESGSSSGSGSDSGSGSGSEDEPDGERDTVD